MERKHLLSYDNTRNCLAIKNDNFYPYSNNKTNLLTKNITISINTSFLIYVYISKIIKCSKIYFKLQKQPNFIPNSKSIDFTSKPKGNYKILRRKCYRNNNRRANKRKIRVIIAINIHD